MRYGIVIPGGKAPEQVELAVAAEAAGWDGVFAWEAGYGPDPWSLLSAVAVRTRRVRLGSMLTPLPWRRPWKVASQVATLDQLSGGRAILAVGVGATDLVSTGEPTGTAERAAMLDDGIDLIRLLWEGGLSYRGTHYEYDSASNPWLNSAATPVQKRIPIWVVAAVPRPKSMRRALRCDGIIPQYSDGGDSVSPADAAALCRWLADNGRADLEVIADGETPDDDTAAARGVVAGWAEAGCTWWLETRWSAEGSPSQRLEEVRRRISAGPPGGA